MDGWIALGVEDYVGSIYSSMPVCNVAAVDYLSADKVPSMDEIQGNSSEHQSVRASKAFNCE